MESRNICIICGQPRKNGIIVVSEFICEACEAEIVNTDVRDEKYPFFIDQLKKLWYKKDA